MFQYLKLIKYFNYIYPIRSFYYKQVRKTFYYYHIQKAIKEANSKYKISSYYDLIDVFNQRPFRGLINTLFEPDNFYFTCKDIAIAVNISVNGFYNKEHTNNESIIDFAYNFSSEIKKIIKLDLILSEELQRIKKNVDLICDNIDRDEIRDTLSTKKKIFYHYFKTFEDLRFSEKITIFHQSESKTWVEWNREDSISVYLNLQKIREGFFMVGFDYSSEKYGWLSRATNNGYYEYFNGEIKRNNIVWLN